MDIEWDDAKRQETLDQRGIDFADVADLEWDTALTAEDTRADYGEPRFVTIGLIHGRLHVMAWTPRDNALRVISLRKANTREQRRYDQS
ncbi:BrnT family toxin [Thalassococcus sp. S3]|uniref:BrnT family toxin n=1 Tax=Thalassococcus sp. S3 TaxID=2017482 RepID=UPI001024201F|nr:BrnT family toxin [Thalassococcus sp. S3]QBF32124.1 hypothetical protein CFI11_12965 [Thalassococcus sp. S3]